MQNEETPEQGERAAMPETDVNPEATSTPETADNGGERESVDADKAASEEDEKPRKRRASARIGELHAQNKAKDAEIERLMRLVESGRTPEQAAGKSKDDDEPKRDQFDDYEAYIEKRAAWVARREFRQQQEVYETKARIEREERAHRVAWQRWNESHDLALEKYGDEYDAFVDVIGKEVTDEQATEIRETENPAELVYFLGKNPKEFEKLKNLSGTSFARAIGRLEAKIEASREKRSAAPAPTTPVRGAAPSGNTLSDNLDIKTWIERRNKQLGR